MLAKRILDIRLLRSSDPRTVRQMANLARHQPVTLLPAITRDLSVATQLAGFVGWQRLRTSARVLGLERHVGLVQDSAGVQHDGQHEPGVLALELHRRRRDPVASAERVCDDPARPGSGHPQLPGQDALV